MNYMKQGIISRGASVMHAAASTSTCVGCSVVAATTYLRARPTTDSAPHPAQIALGQICGAAHWSCLYVARLVAPHVGSGGGGEEEEEPTMSVRLGWVWRVERDCIEREEHGSERVPGNKETNNFYGLFQPLKIK
jgi:hypothetical protein